MKIATIIWMFICVPLSMYMFFWHGYDAVNLLNAATAVILFAAGQKLNTVQNGKGSKPRSIGKKYRDNYDLIQWKNVSDLSKVTKSIKETISSTRKGSV